MYKLFTVQEATELIPFVDHSLREMQDAMRGALEVHESLQKVKPNSIEERNLSEESRFLLRSIQENKAELDRLGVHIKDLECGLVDFPSQLGAEVVYLCWEQGQEAITHYHRLNESELERQPLPDNALAQGVAWA